MTAAVETIPAAPSFLDGLRPEALGAPESGIVEVMNYGRTRQGMIPLWAGEGDVPTPAFITVLAGLSSAMTRSPLAPV